MKWAQLRSRDRGRLVDRARRDDAAYLRELGHGVPPSKAELRVQAAAALAEHDQPVRVCPPQLSPAAKDAIAARYRQEEAAELEQLGLTWSPWAPVAGVPLCWERHTVLKASP